MPPSHYMTPQERADLYAILSNRQSYPTWSACVRAHQAVYPHRTRAAIGNHYYRCRGRVPKASRLGDALADTHGIHPASLGSKPTRTNTMIANDKLTLSPYQPPKATPLPPVYLPEPTSYDSDPEVAACLAALADARLRAQERHEAAAKATKAQADLLAAVIGALDTYATLHLPLPSCPPAVRKWYEAAYPPNVALAPVLDPVALAQEAKGSPITYTPASNQHSLEDCCRTVYAQVAPHVVVTDGECQYAAGVKTSLDGPHFETLENLPCALALLREYAVESKQKQWTGTIRILRMSDTLDIARDTVFAVYVGEPTKAPQGATLVRVGG